ncbi:unnamed protein product [Urochloa humidicola]
MAWHTNLSVLPTTFSLLLLVALLEIKLVRASSVRRGQAGNSTVPSTASLASCRTSCGNLTFSYPFGIGPGCFRRPDFELICNESVQPPRLFFRDGITQVTYNISTADTGNNLYRGMNNYVWFTFSFTIPLIFGVHNYNMSWDTPGKSFEINYVQLNVTGCDFDIHVIDRVTNSTTLWPCNLKCPTTEITDTVARQNCNGTGCCPVFLYDAFELKFVRHRKNNLEAHHNRSSLWHYINVTTSSYGYLSWKMIDQPRCSRNRESNRTFACASKNSRCMDIDRYQFMDTGYYCKCNGGYMGNPYILDGCSRDKGYNPAAQEKASCSHQCGNINVPFPFGVEEGCAGRKQFYLNCTNVTTSILLLENYYVVTDIDVHQGLIKYIVPDKGEGSIASMSDDDPGIFIDSGRAVSLEWVVANLSCSEAKANISGYACGGENSSCIPVNSTDGYAGYRCRCTDGFQGNPYIKSGCQDINECSQRDKCHGAVCQNTIGSFNCIKCSQKTVYDPTKNQCFPVKRQKNVLIGIITGLSSGFSVLLVALSAIFITRRWKRNIQERLRRMYFRRNKGLLLEQLIQSDENASENTKIFSLEELEKATNNFDSTRILGRGGHGMVYKGILSDQRVVAIKMSKIIEEGEINQFINEVAILSQINHRNIVRLYGCCLETEVPLLVYDFIPNGSLYGILHGDTGSGLHLSWDACLRIAAEAAGALYYLHSAASVSVFHRDVKSSNILLDSNFTAKVSDFGSSRLVPIDQTHVVTNVQGTFGYLDPEYYHTGQLNEKSDVYSFGVVLLELLVRKKPIITNESGEKQNLGNYFLWERKHRPTTAIVDPQVLEEASEEELNCVASLVEMCLRLQGDKRPTMKQIEVALQFLRTKRAELHEASVGKGEERQTLQPRRAIDSYELSAMDFVARKTKSASSEHSNKFDSLEEEFLTNAGLPR